MTDEQRPAWIELMVTINELAKRGIKDSYTESLRLQAMDYVEQVRQESMDINIDDAKTIEDIDYLMADENERYMILMNALIKKRAHIIDHGE